MTEDASKGQKQARKSKITQITDVIRDKNNFVIIIALVTLLFTWWQLSAAYDLFNRNIQWQRENELNDHIAEMTSLELELRMDTEGMQDVEENRTNLITGIKTIHAQLILKNLEKSVSNGRIRNRQLKTFINEAYFNGVQLNQRILFENSPEMFIAEIKGQIPNTQMTNMKNQTIDKIVIYIDSFNKTLTLVKIYRNCLETNRSMDVCGNYYVPDIVTRKT